MTVPTGTILKVVASMVFDDGNIAQNVYNAVITGGGGPWDEADVVDDAVAWVDLLYTAVEAYAAASLQGSQVQVYEWDTVGLDWDEIGSDVWAWVGTSVTDEMPRGVAALLNAKTTDADVSGKKYVPGTVEGGATDGLWIAAYLLDLVDYGGLWVGGFVGGTSGADWNPGVWSVVDEALYDMSLTVVIPTIPAYQRRRKRGVGI